MPHTVTTPIPPRPKPFPWPYPASALQGAVGGAGGRGTVMVPKPPLNYKYFSQWPYEVLRVGWLATPPVRM